MAEYYLISQLPALDGLGDHDPVPITQERFMELCGRFLKKPVLEELEKMTLIPEAEPVASCSRVLEAWNLGERDLRLALGKARADKLGKTFDLQGVALAGEVQKTAATAVEMTNPLEAERFLWEYRLRFLELLRPIEPFSQDFVFYYGLKLKLLARIRQFDAAVGESVYKNIYNTILG